MSLNQLHDLHHPGEHPPPINSQDKDPTYSVEKKGEYLAEEIANSSNHWNVHFYEPMKLLRLQWTLSKNKSQ